MKDVNDFDSADDRVPPVCRATVDRLQLVLDGDLSGTELDADPHPTDCVACRERIAAARLLLALLTTPPEPIPLPVGLTASILSAVRTDRRARVRRNVFAIAGGLAVAAAILVAIRWSGETQPNVPLGSGDLAQDSTTGQLTPKLTTERSRELAPAPRLSPETQPVRLGDEFAKAEQALRGSSRPITEPAAVAPQVLVKLTDVLTAPATPPAFEPARISLIELPVAAQTGLQPVTDVAQKAFTRLLRDVGAVSTKPKS